MLVGSLHVFEAARERFGDSLHLLHDAHHRMTPNEAAQFRRSLEPYRLFWLKDPTPAENQEDVGRYVASRMSAWKNGR